MGSRDIPYDHNTKCDSCGALGAFDFMGDNLCDSCAGPPSEEHVDDSEDQYGRCTAYDGDTTRCEYPPFHCGPHSYFDNPSALDRWPQMACKTPGCKHPHKVKTVSCRRCHMTWMWNAPVPCTCGPESVNGHWDVWCFYDPELFRWTVATGELYSINTQRDCVFDRRKDIHMTYAQNPGNWDVE